MIWSVEDNLDVSRVTQFYKTLTSPDPNVANCAWSQLQEVITKRSGIKSPSRAHIQSFLNEPQKNNEGRRGDVQSLWSIVRKSLQRLSLKVSFDQDNWILLDHETGSISPQQRKLSYRVLRHQVQQRQPANLKSSPDQGRAFGLISESPESNYWIGNCRFLSFAA